MAASRVEPVTYRVESRMEYPGGRFSTWTLCAIQTSLDLTAALMMIKRYRETSSAFMQYRIRGVALTK